ncbi:hypothetical protein OAC51_08825 [Flavobacteriaceae bacterium]|nr:hypothetical protein [Flavobacteriaceae bacterium]
MKNLELQNYGVATMSAQEMRTTNGGSWRFWKAVISIAIVIGASFFAANQ